jgi:hypothetical protein
MGSTPPSSKATIKRGNPHCLQQKLHPHFIHSTYPKAKASIIQQQADEGVINSEVIVYLIVIKVVKSKYNRVVNQNKREEKRRSKKTKK